MRTGGGLESNAWDKHNHKGKNEYQEDFSHHSSRARASLGYHDGLGAGVELGCANHCAECHVGGIADAEPFSECGELHAGSGYGRHQLGRAAGLSK